MRTKIENVVFSAWSAKLENPATACTKQAPKRSSVTHGQIYPMRQNKEVNQDTTFLNFFPLKKYVFLIC